MENTTAIRSITTFEELETIRAFWQERQHHPNSDLELFELVCSNRPEVISPVVFVERDAQLFSLLIARLERSNFTPAIGYFKPFGIPAIVLRVLHEGLIGDETETVAAELVSHLLSFLKSKQVDAITFHHFREDSSLVKALLNGGKQFWFNNRPNWSVHRSMTIGSEAGFLLSAMKPKHRSWIRKKGRDLDSASENQTTWHWLSKFEDLDKLCAEMENVAALSYQRGLGAGFVNNEEHRKRLALFSGRGQLRIQLLVVKGNVKAYWMGIVYRNVFHSWATSYDSELSKYEPGTQLFLRLTDELVKEGVNKLDFGLGDAHYKKRFGDNSWREASFTLYAPTFKGYLIGATMGIFDIIDKTGRKVVAKIKLEDLIKTKWRHHVQK
jgi:Acetyltransferase (GNAT) domain